MRCYISLTLSDFKLSILSLYGFVNVSKHLNDNLQCVKSQTVLFLRCDNGLMLTLHKLSLCYFRQ